MLEKEQCTILLSNIIFLPSINSNVLIDILPSQRSIFWQANKFKRAEWFWKWTQLTKDILMSGDEVDWIRVEKTHHHRHSWIFNFGCIIIKSAVMYFQFWCFTYKNSYSKIISSGNYTNWGLSRSQSCSYASFVLSKLPACFISQWTHADIWTNC